MAVIWPASVSSPTAITSASASPATTIALERILSPTFLGIESLSPVKIDSLTSKEFDLVIFASAGISSPVFS